MRHEKEHSGFSRLGQCRTWSFTARIFFEFREAGLVKRISFRNLDASRFTINERRWRSARCASTGG